MQHIQPATQPATGDPVEARCTKCRKLTSHTLVPAEPTATMLQCSVCNRQRKVLSTSAPKKPATRRTADPAADERKEWAALEPAMKSTDAASYSMTASYKLKSLINHPLFGLGQVQRVIGPKKIEVLFSDGKKTMRCK